MSAEGKVRDRNNACIGLIETLRWGPVEGFVRLERHLARLARSAARLGLPLSPAEARQRLASQAGDGQPLRIRLELGPDGHLDVAAQPLLELEAGAAWTIAVASKRVDSGDPLLRHKTTRRTVFEAARAEFSREEADEVILLNERGEVCEGTITSLFLDRGEGLPLLTPPLACGLLAGVLREELLESGRAAEAVLGMDDLRRAPRLLLGNSLRGLIEARLA